MIAGDNVRLSDADVSVCMLLTHMYCIILTHCGFSSMFPTKMPDALLLWGYKTPDGERGVKLVKTHTWVTSAGCVGCSTKGTH